MLWPLCFLIGGGVSRDEVKGLLPVGWGSVVDTVFGTFEANDISSDRIIGAREINGHAMVFCGLMSFREFNIVVKLMYRIQGMSHDMCVVCGGPAYVCSSENLPFCREHIKVKVTSDK